MKLITYYNPPTDSEQLAILVGNKAYNTHELHRDLPDNMMDFLWGEDETMVIAKSIDAKLKAGELPKAKGIDLQQLHLLSPVTHPPSLRDGYAFRQHVATARQNRGLDMIPEFDDFPVFYFSNHNAIQGSGDVECMPDHFRQLDFELEIAIVIGAEGRNIKAADADDYIAGFMVMNDMSARFLQMEEMKLNLGPAKGKDFCTAVGPYLVTPDELSAYLIPPPPGHIGKHYQLEMTASINDKTWVKNNMSTMNWTFAEIIERVSYGVDIFPGDIIGSGTVGGGCFLEINGTEKRKNPNHKPIWLKEDDEIVMEITGLGKLYNRIVGSRENHSILQYLHKKKP
ncbi:MAG: fumarylacetoacetate hydrolase family protein [Chitinophagales bacterium]|jgi:fumarylacetoacetate (FAA) hydrolase|nr:fumarylacetoacetate hydrolase family protein [Chitinophagales bacterium]